MPLDRIPDWEQRLARHDAFWRREIIDRPVVCMSVPKTVPEHPGPKQKAYASPREYWMDTEREVDKLVAYMKNHEFYGDSLPNAFPNLGPEVFNAFFGTELDYTFDTAWAVPNLKDWSQADSLAFSTDNFYWKKLLELTDACLEAAKGLFYVGISDLHNGGDAVAAFRDPAELNVDMLMAPDDVKRLLARLNEVYFQVLDFYCEKLAAAGQPCTAWPGIVSSKKWYVPSNDFSCMISEEMFQDVFLPGIIEECRHLEASIYHLDGPNALRHLDALLEIKELNAIQWVYGAGNGRASDWFDIYKRCQAADKGIQLYIGIDELEGIMANLRPEGVFMDVHVESREQADYVLKQVSSWR